MKTISVIGVLCCVWCLYAKPVREVKNGPIFRTVVTTRNVTNAEYNPLNNRTPQESPYIKGSYIDVQILEKPHNLFIGRCTRDLEELYNENIILNNDGKSHVNADIRINMDKQVDIKCVKVLDQMPSTASYPSYVGGGVGHDYIEIRVTTKYGEGFQFFIQIMGNFKKGEDDEPMKNNSSKQNAGETFRKNNRL